MTGMPFCPPPLQSTTHFIQFFITMYTQIAKFTIPTQYIYLINDKFDLLISLGASVPILTPILSLLLYHTSLLSLLCLSCVIKPNAWTQLLFTDTSNYDATYL